MRLFHVSEESNISVFEPRPVPSPDTGVTGLCVWAVDEAHLANYLLPRDCPRVSFAAGESTSSFDSALLAGAARVVAVEQGWLERIEKCSLYLYEFPRETFQLIDRSAGYWISRVAVPPLAVKRVDDLLGELRAHGVDVRVLPSLWDLRDQVAASTLEFSIIRFRNARARD